MQICIDSVRLCICSNCIFDLNFMIYLTYYLLLITMFKWAHKDKATDRSSNSIKSCADTQLHSHTSSPAHSTYSVYSNNSRGMPSKKLKMITPYKDRCRQTTQLTASKIDNSISKSELMRFVNSKQNKRVTKD